MATYYVNSFTGSNLNDGSELTPFETISYAVTVAIGGNDLIKFTGVDAGNIALTTSVNITCTDNSKIRGTGAYGLRIKNGTHPSVSNFRNLDISGFDYAIDSDSNNLEGMQSNFIDCKLDGNVRHGLWRRNRVRYYNTVFLNGIIGEKNKHPTFYNSRLENCSFINCIDVPLSFDRQAFSYDSIQQDLVRNYFKNCSISIRSNQVTADPISVKNNKFDGCSFRFFTADPLLFQYPTFIREPLTSFVLCNTIAELNAKLTSDLSVDPTATLTSITSDQFDFQPISLDPFNYPTSKTDSQILNRHIGANRYAITQTVPVANADYTDVLGVYESNKVSPTPLVYELEVPRAGFARTATLHFTRSGNTEQLGTDGEVEILIETSTDGTNFTTLGTFLSGITSSTLDFDFLNAPAKAIRASIQPVGAAFGELHLEGITVDFKTLEDRLSQTDTRTLYTAGNIPTNVSELNNRAIHNPVANFTQAVEANQFMLSASGGVESIDGAQWMDGDTVNFAGAFSVSIWHYASNYSNYVTGDVYQLIGSRSINGWYIRVGAPTATTADVQAVVTVTDGTRAAVKNYTDTQFDSIVAGKWTNYVLVFNRTSIKLYVNAILVSTTTFADSAIIPEAKPIRIGNDLAGGAIKPILANEAVDEIKIYDSYELTQSQIEENYRADQFNNSHLR